MPENLTLSVQTLVTYAGQRCEDAYIYHGVSYFIDDLQRIPRGAWGKLRWSDQWHQGWQAACANRRDEARTCRDKLNEIGGHLLQVAADYTHTDQTAAISFNLINQDTRPYLDYVSHGMAAPVAHPGRLPPDPVYSLPTPSDSKATPLGYLADNDKLNKLRNEKLPYSQWYMADGNSGEMLANGENDELNDFVQKYHQRLHDIDGVLDSNAPGTRRPYADIILPAWLSAPSIVDNHADLFYSVRNTYAERRTSWDSDDASLTADWTGAGAAAYNEHDNITKNYLDAVKQQADWLAGEGHNAATLLRQLRTAYAGIGYRYISRMLDQLAEYESVRNSSIARVTDCTSPGGAAKALIATINDLNSELVDQERRSLDAAQDILKAEAMVNQNAPNFDSRNHAALPFPQEPTRPASVWTDSHTWQPKSGQ
jgi:hypothetical protein